MSRARAVTMTVACALACALLATACDVAQHSERAERHRVRGEVVEVNKELGQAVIRHEDIPDFMPAMQMSFDVPNPRDLRKLAAGQTIEFILEVRDDSFRVDGVKVLTHGAHGDAGTSGLLAAHAHADNAPPEPAPPFDLRDQDGTRVTLASFAGRTLLLDFIYTHCPRPCPIVTGVHVEVQRALPEALRERVHFVSITLDPARDTAAALTNYARARGVDFANWSFLRGEARALEEVWRAYGVGSGQGEGGEIDHLVVSFLIDGEGRIRRRYLGVEHSVEGLVGDILELVSESE